MNIGHCKIDGRQRAGWCRERGKRPATREMFFSDKCDECTQIWWELKQVALAAVAAAAAWASVPEASEAADRHPHPPPAVV